MVKVKYDFKKKKWFDLEKGSKDGIYLDGYLRKKLDFIHKIIRKNYDAVILIDGKERIGKSTLAITIGWYLSNCSIDEGNISSNMDDAADKIATLPDKSILIVDEGSLVFGSKDAMSRQQKQLIKILDVVGQKNMIIIICLPSFFDLNKTIALRRSLFLLHCYKDPQWNRGRVAYFGEGTKSKLYIIGRKNFGSYSKPPAEKTFTFTDYEPPFYKKYLEIKKRSLLAALTEGKKQTMPQLRASVKAEIIKPLFNNLPIKNKTELAKLLQISAENLRSLANYPPKAK